MIEMLKFFWFFFLLCKVMWASSTKPTSQPSRVPSCQPSCQPSRQPTSQPSMQPYRQPTSQPSRQPTNQPSGKPTRQPTGQPSNTPSKQPSSRPSKQPTLQPTKQPFSRPSAQPTYNPTTQPSVVPSTLPSNIPSNQPSKQPFVFPSRQPSSQPSKQPSSLPSGQPFSRPSKQPSIQPSRKPSTQPTTQPSQRPSRDLARKPSSQPSRKPSGQPTSNPLSLPTGQPSSLPSCQPSNIPTKQPSIQPTLQPTSQPTFQPVKSPSNIPTLVPSTIFHPKPPPPDYISMLLSSFSSLPILIGTVLAFGFIFFLCCYFVYNRQSQNRKSDSNNEKEIGTDEENHRENFNSRNSNKEDLRSSYKDKLASRRIPRNSDNKQEISDDEGDLTSIYGIDNENYCGSYDDIFMRSTVYSPMAHKRQEVAPSFSPSPIKNVPVNLNLSKNIHVSSPLELQSAVNATSNFEMALQPQLTSSPHSLAVSPSPTPVLSESPPSLPAECGNAPLQAATINLKQSIELDTTTTTETNALPSSTLAIIIKSDDEPSSSTPVLSTAMTQTSYTISQRLIHLFEYMDMNDDGIIRREVLLMGLRAPTNEVITSMLNKLSVNGDHTSTKLYIMKVFQDIDKSQSGLITLDDLKEYLCVHGNL